MTTNKTTPPMRFLSIALFGLGNDRPGNAAKRLVVFSSGEKFHKQSVAEGFFALRA